MYINSNTGSTVLSDVTRTGRSTRWQNHPTMTKPSMSKISLETSRSYKSPTLCVVRLEENVVSHEEPAPHSQPKGIELIPRCKDWEQLIQEVEFTSVWWQQKFTLVTTWFAMSYSYQKTTIPFWRKIPEAAVPEALASAFEVLSCRHAEDRLDTKEGCVKGDAIRLYTDGMGTEHTWAYGS